MTNEGNKQEIEEDKSQSEESEIIKSSQFPLNKEVASYLKSVVDSDPYNKFCVDCFNGESTHANITYGTFICTTCAELHRSKFGQSEHYIKSLTGEQWDDYQIISVSPSFGGNRQFFDLMKEFNQQ